MAKIPRERSLDSTLDMLSEGYPFIRDRCRRHQSDLFETRLMLQRVICMSGPEASRIFYEGDRFTRRRAIPPTTLMLLQDVGSVQLLDGEAHRWRKQMFLSLVGPDAAARLVDEMEAQLRARVVEWERRSQVTLLPEMEDILCAAVCRWAGVPLPAREVPRRAREFGAMVDGAGSVGPRNWRGLLLRSRTEKWIRTVIEQVRSGALDVPPGSAAHAVASHRDRDGKPLDPSVAAVELINVLRPTVAVSRYLVFAAHALHGSPGLRSQLRSGDGADLERFAQEVRRYYPFFPFVGGRVREEFVWRGHPFSRGTWVMFDLYGTNHDPRTWTDPEEFRPDRFRDWDRSLYNLVPQGGGEIATGHRCPGEPFTIGLIQRTARLLTTAVDYEVPEQDLRIDLSRMPAMPASGFVIRKVRAVA